MNSNVCGKNEVKNMYKNPKWILDFVTEKIDEHFSWIIYYGVKTVVDTRDGYFLFCVNSSQPYEIKRYMIDINSNYEKYNGGKEMNIISITPDGFITPKNYKLRILNQTIHKYGINNSETNDYEYMIYKTSPNQKINAIIKGYYANPLHLPTLLMQYPLMFPTFDLSQLIKTINLSGKFEDNNIQKSTMGNGGLGADFNYLNRTPIKSKIDDSDGNQRDIIIDNQIKVIQELSAVISTQSETINKLMNMINENRK